MQNPPISMTEERRYHDDEIREIMDLAIRQDEVQFPSLPASHGLTVSELQQIGQEVGLSPARVAAAVAEFEERGRSPTRSTMWGVPTSVERIARLPRALSDHEWEMLVAELRVTFGVKGEVVTQGETREWSAANRHVFVEPTEDGYRLRMTDSVAAEIGASLMFGGFILAFAVMIFVVLLGKADPGFRFAVPAFFAILGGGVMAAGAAFLPGWARSRTQQLEHVAARVMALIESRGPDAPSD
jgi:hypothetical protein